MFKLIKFLSPYKGKVTIMLILLFLQVLGTLYIPTLTADIVNNGIVKGNLDYVFRTGGLMLAVAVLIALVSISESYFSTSIFAWMGRDIRNALFKKSQTLTVDEFNRFGAAPCFPIFSRTPWQVSHRRFRWDCAGRSAKS